MATNAQWMASPVRRVCCRPAIMGTRVASIAFDYRRVVGPVEVEAVLDEAIREARTDPGFVQRLSRMAVETKAPVGRFHDFVMDRIGTIDLKHGGITAITNLARLYAIEAGISENRTVERLRGAAAAGVLSDVEFDDLREALRVLWRIRLEHHVDLIEAGTDLDDNVDPASLRPISRRALGAALRVVADAQGRVAKRRG